LLSAAIGTGKTKAKRNGVKNMGKQRTESNGSVKDAVRAQRKPSKLLHLVLTVVILAVGVTLAVMLAKSRKPPQKVDQPTLAPLVQVQPVRMDDIQMVVRGFGTVSPDIQVEIVPQVAGNIVYVNPQFKAGGFVKAGQYLVQIDPKDYELALEQARALVADAQVKLDLEQAEAEVARREWQQLNPGKEPDSPLVVREPQVRQAQAALKSAQAQLDKADLNLERTRISLPIDAVIIDKKVDLGQFAAVGQSIGTAYGIERVEIEVPLEDRELAWFDVPASPGMANRTAASAKKTTALVKADFAGAEHTWTGYVTRTAGMVDKTSRMVSVVVEVSKPFENSGSRPPLMPGMFVEVLINGRVLKNAVAVPRDAVRNGNEVWVVEDGRLYLRSLRIARTDRNFAYAVSGLDDGANIVISSLETVTDGMKVRIESDRGAVARIAPPDERN